MRTKNQTIFSERMVNDSRKDAEVETDHENRMRKRKSGISLIDYVSIFLMASLR